MKRIAIFVSGTGSNARKIMEYFAPRADVSVALLVSNKPDAPALQLAASFHVPQTVLERNAFYHSQQILDTLEAHQIDFIVLAGFLWKIPDYLVERFHKRMINIHPALLPNYGGKGMYGIHVHEAVHAAGDTESGITIHYVNAHYDEGAIVFQARCTIDPNDSPQDIARKVLVLEHHYLPLVIDALLLGTPVPHPGNGSTFF